MFDYYQPTEQFVCGECGLPLEWQGKDGPNAPFVWRQGEAAPIDQPIVEESRMDPVRRATYRLPPTFRLKGFCERHHITEATGRCDGEVWTEIDVAPEPVERTIDPKVRDAYWELERALRTPNPLDSVRSIVVDYINLGVSREEMIDRMEVWRRRLASEGREADEDVVLEVMDLIVGFSGPDVAL